VRLQEQAQKEEAEVRLGGSFRRILHLYGAGSDSSSDTPERREREFIVCSIERIADRECSLDLTVHLFETAGDLTHLNAAKEPDASQRAVFRGCSAVIVLLANASCVVVPQVQIRNGAGEVPGLGAYFVDGTTLDQDSESTIWKLAHRTNPERVNVVRYFRGPVPLCEMEGVLSCRERTQTVTTAICDDLREKRISSFVVFGYSRGVWIANKAAQRTSVQCPELGGRYLFGGFLDGVTQSDYLRNANQIGEATRWVHINRNDHTDVLYPTTHISGGIAHEEFVTGFSHSALGKNDAMVERLAQASNVHAGEVLFH
jgi:hypothetical protein